jgi:hypothetical protein
MLSQSGSVNLTLFGALGAIGGWYWKGWTGLAVGAFAGGLLGWIVTGGDSFYGVNGKPYLVHTPQGGSDRYGVFFHGNGAKIDDLRETMAAFDEAEEPRVWIVPQLGPSGEISTKDLLAILDDSGAEEPLDVLAYSGGFVAAAQLLGSRRWEVRNVGLLDALYGNLDVFEKFSKGGGTLVNVYGPSTKALSQQMMRDGIKASFQESTVGHGLVSRKYGASVLNRFG